MNDLTHISVEFYIPISHILCGNTKALKSFSYLIWTIFAKYNGQLLHSFHSFSSVESHKPIFSPFLIIKMKTWENMEQHLDLRSSTSMADTLALFSPILPSPRYPYAKCSADSSWVNREWEKVILVRKHFAEFLVFSVFHENTYCPVNEGACCLRTHSHTSSVPKSHEYTAKEWSPCFSTYS